MSLHYRDLFKSTAGYYAKYRPPYPPELIEHLVNRFELDGTGRLLDIGCGTGQLTIPLAIYFESAIGLDPEPEMLVEAQRLAEVAGVETIRWLEGGSDDLAVLRPQIGDIRLVTFGASFHWVEREQTLRILDSMIEAGGGIVVTASASRTWEYGDDWHEAVKGVLTTFLGEERRAGSGTYERPPERHEALFERSAFSKLETFVHRFEREWDIDGVIGHLYSTSYASPYVLGDRQEKFEAALRHVLGMLKPDGVFSETVELHAILARRP